MKNSPSDGPHSEGLPERGDEDLLQMRRNRTYSEGMSKPGLTGEKQVKIFLIGVATLSLCQSRRKRKIEFELKVKKIESMSEIWCYVPVLLQQHQV